MSELHGTTTEVEGFEWHFATNVSEFAPNVAEISKDD
jgi:hypothetical protein